MKTDKHFIKIQFIFIVVYYIMMQTKGSIIKKDSIIINRVSNIYRFYIWHIYFSFFQQKQSFHRNNPFIILLKWRFNLRIWKMSFFQKLKSFMSTVTVYLLNIWTFSKFLERIWKFFNKRIHLTSKRKLCICFRSEDIFIGTQKFYQF